MKKSKVFIAFSAVVLAATGLFAFKTTAKDPATVGYYQGATGIVTVNGITCTTASQPLPCQFQGHQLYFSTTLNTPLFKQ
jgi:hypothetical protein